MGKSSGGQPQTVQTSQAQTADPWSVQQPYLESGFQRADDWYQNQQPQFYPGQTYTGFAPQQQQALQLTENRALQGSPIQGAGQQEYLNTLGGQYTAQGNPYLGGVAESIANRVQPQVQSRFAAAGRSGSGAESSEAQRILSDAIAPYAFGNYETERGRQNAAMLGAPGYAQQDYNDFNQLGQVGSAYRGQEDLALGDQINRHNFGQNQPYTGLAQYMGLLGGTYGGTTTSAGMQPYQDPYRQDPFQNLLGLGSLGLGAYSAGLFGGGGSVAAAVPAAAVGFSSREFKDELADIDHGDMREAIRAMPVKKWRYKEPFQDRAEHIGPYAEDWRERTGLGDGKTINLMDAVGVLLAAVQSLDAEVNDLRAQAKAR